MNPNPLLDITRRQFLGRVSTGIGAAALASLLNPKLLAAQGGAGIPHFAPKAKRVVYLFQSGGRASPMSSASSARRTLRPSITTRA